MSSCHLFPKIKKLNPTRPILVPTKLSSSISEKTNPNPNPNPNPTVPTLVTIKLCSSISEKAGTRVPQKPSRPKAPPPSPKKKI